MDDVEYLKKSRENNKAWMADFRRRYDLDSVQIDPVMTPDEWLESHTHHAEYGAARH